MKMRPYQQEALDKTFKEFEKVRSVLTVMATGLGKCFARNTRVMLYDGNIVMVQDVKVNTLLMGPDGTPRRVTSLARGREQLYDVIPTKGNTYRVNESHILSLKITGMSNTRRKCVTGGDGIKYTSGDIANITVKDYLKSSKTFKHVAKGYKVGIEFHEKHIPSNITPYLLGVWLGDGHSRSPQITTMDKEIVSEMRKYTKKMGLKLVKQGQCGKAFTYALSQYGKTHDGNPLRSFLKHYNLLQNKHIPDEYKTNSPYVQLEVLAGILDTDGYLIDGCYEFVNKNQGLAMDVAFIARSLGLAAYIKPVKKQCTNTGVWGKYFRVQISGNTHIIPCRIPRKKAKQRLQKKDVLVTGIKLEPAGVGGYYGFELFGFDRRFLLGDFTVAHNTIFFAHVIDAFKSYGRVMVLAHREELIFQAKDKVGAVTGADIDVEMGNTWASQWDHFKTEIVVSSIQTQNAGREESRMERFNPNEFSLLVIDEAHHAPADSYRRVIDYYKQNPKLKVLGVTATPDRADEKALGQIFESVSYEYDIRDGIDDGWLVPINQRAVFVKDLDFSAVRTTAGDLNGKDLANVLEFEENLHGIASPTVELCGDRKTLMFAASIAQAERLTEIINRHKQDSARFVCGGTPKDIRRNMLKDYAKGSFQYLVNVGVATEGFDEPGIEVVVMARPTKSRCLYTQMAGRGTRPLPGIVDGQETADLRRIAIAGSAKPTLEVIDFVGNAGRHKLMTTADILGGKYEDDVVERAKKNAEEKKGKPTDTISELEEAERQLRKEMKERAETAIRDKVKIRAQFSTADVNPFDVLDITPWRERGWDKAKPPTQKQLDYIRNNGMNPDGLSHRHASQVITTIIKRKDSLPCSRKQVKLLKRYKYPTNITKAAATKIIGAIVANNWRRPA